MFRLTKTKNSVLLWALLVALISACTSTGGGQTLQAVPTQTLIPLPPTGTPLPPTATPSPPPRLRPSDLVVTPEWTTQERLVRQAMDDIAAQEGISDALIQAPVQDERRWRDAETLDCEPDTSEDRPPAQIEGYELILLASDNVYVYHTNLEVVAQCSVTPLTEIPGDVLIRIDPVAAEILRIAQETLSAQIDVPVRRIRFEAMQIAVWEDSSLGCPVEGQTYPPIHLNGYVLRLSANDTSYTYHSDAERVLLCEGEGESTD